MSLTSKIRTAAERAGFDLIGVTPAIQPPGYARLVEWIQRGYAGEMKYIDDRREAYRHPDSVLSGVRSIVMLGMNYKSGASVDPAPGYARVSIYAWGGVDYHDLIHRRLKEIIRLVQAESPPSRARGVVDTAPLLERDFARLAGLGWIGKNTMLINRKYGSYFFLAALLVDVELDYDDPFPSEHCGTCTACLDHCPTDAFPEPYVLDARRCISYLTIEHRSRIDDDLKRGLDNWLFGCDICQEVCPWNRKSPLTDKEEFQPLRDMCPVDLCQLFEMDDAEFRERFRRTPLWRAKRPLILRNAAILIGNQKLRTAVPTLKKGLCHDDELVRDACRWALEQIQSVE